MAALLTILLRRGCRCSQQRSFLGLGCRFDHVLPFLFLACLAFLGLFTRQKIGLARPGRGITVQVTTVDFGRFNKNIFRRPFPKERKPTTRIISKFVAVIEHSLDDGRHSQCPLPLFLGELVGQERHILRLRGDRNPRHHHSCRRPYSQTAARGGMFEPAAERLPSARLETFREQIHRTQDKADVERQGRRGSRVLQVNFESDWPIDGQIVRYGKFRNSSIFTPQSYIRSLTKFKILSGQAIRNVGLSRVEADNQEGNSLNPEAWLFEVVPQTAKETFLLVLGLSMILIGWWLLAYETGRQATVFAAAVRGVGALCLFFLLNGLCPMLWIGLDGKSMPFFDLVALSYDNAYAS